jgi:NAD(P)-dependent dehydrogenase (short-subunit alcohol dehydrogenase family)
MTPYSATKHAVVGLSRSLRIEAAVHGVGVSALCPGGIETPDNVARNRAIITYGARPAMVARLGRFAPGMTALVSAREYRAERRRNLREPIT